MIQIVRQHALAEYINGSFQHIVRTEPNGSWRTESSSQRSNTRPSWYFSRRINSERNYEHIHS
jgi:hypothetical protein